MLAAALAAMTLFQGAPADVPQGHWAHWAVDELFAAGVLQGYPAGKPLRLEKIRPNGAWLKRRLTWWKQEGLLLGYPDGMCGARPPSNYEQAVAAHAAWANIAALWKSEKEPPAAKAGLLRWIPDLAKAISMREPELTRLGADVPEMIRTLEAIRSRIEGVARFGGK